MCNSSVCTAFSVVRICRGEVAVLISLKHVVDHAFADTETNSLLEYF